MPRVDKAISEALAAAKESLYRVLDAMDDLEKKCEYDRATLARFSSRVGGIGEDSWYLEHKMERGLHSPEET